MGKLIGIAFVIAVIILLGYLFWIYWKNKQIQAQEAAEKKEADVLIDATVCGHKTKIDDWVEAFGERTKTKVPVEKGKTLYCHKCLEKMAIRCAWCGKTIFIGDPITLYSPRDKDKKMPEYAVVYSKEDNSYVGCFRMNCAESGADRAGFWYPTGEVHRVPTIYEMSLMDMDKGGNGVVVIEDLSKP